jgi:DMSO reductase family type II enzyme heme b subunit
VELLSKKVSLDSSEFSKPGASAWGQAQSEVVDLIGVPISMQPSMYIASTMQGREVGKVKKVQVSSMHNGQEIAFRLEWADPDQDNERTDTNVFPDGAALLFPLAEDAPLMTMGAEGQPVNGWHWRADNPHYGRSNIATGLGTTEITDPEAIEASSDYIDGRWSIVFRRSLTNAAEDQRQFALGGTVKVAYAVWEGRNGERAGLKAFSPQWIELTLEA